MLILEGGAGGHMRHPFDLDDVKTGDDLVAKFKQIAQEIKEGNLPDTKIDGVNTSIKLVDTPEGKQFAMDRGSGKPLDVQGITIDKLTQKFSEGHGMIAAGKIVIGIFNDALPAITQELKALGLYDDSSKFFNMEYVKGTTNVLSYDHDFLKIHGVNQFYEKSIRGTPVRPGLERPIDPETNKPIKDPSTPVDYDEAAMNSMVEKLNKYSGKYGFKVYSSIPSKAIKEFDFSQVDSQPAPVTISAGNIDQQTLGQRLKTAKNRIGQEVLLKTGKKIPAQGKEIYKAVLGASSADKNADPKRQIPLDQLLAKQEDYQKAIDGAVFWHATRLFGNVIIDAMEVDHPAVHGPAADHEGMVIYLKGDNFATKITGEFILGGEASSFRKDEPADEKEAEPAVQQGKTIALFPGSFKPPHVGHMAVVNALASKYDQVLVLVSDPVTKKSIRSDITAQNAEEIFNIYIKELGIGNAKAIASSAPSPIRAAYEIVEKEKFAPNTTLVIATSTKDAGRYPQATLDSSAVKNPTKPNAKEVTIPAVKADSGKAFSATDFRKTIAAVEAGSEKPEALYQFMPNISDSAKQQVVKILLGSTQPIDLNELLHFISEMATMAGGNVEGATGGFGTPLKRKKKKGIKEMNEEEVELRQIIKDAIRLYKHNELQEFKKQKLEEQHLRHILRKLIMEVGDDQPIHDNTGINVLEDLLKKIIPIIQTDYKIMTTSETQRISFRAHILNAIQNSLKPDLYRKEEIPSGAPPIAEEKKVKIDLEDVELDKSKFIDVFDTDKKKAEEEEKLKTPESRLSAGLDKEKLDSTGRNMALQTFKKIDNSVMDAYTILDDVKDKDLFYDYLITNLKLYFDKFEEEMSDMPDSEPSTPEYDAEKEKKEQEDVPVEV